MAAKIEPWIEEVATAEINAAIAWREQVKKTSNIKPDPEASSFSDEGSVLRNEVLPELHDRECHVQVVKFIYAKPPVTALVSDGQLQVKARFTNRAVQTFSEAIGEELDSTLKGDILLLKRFTINSTPWGPADQRVELVISELAYLTTQRKIIGTPAALSNAVALLSLVATLSVAPSNDYISADNTPSVLQENQHNSDARSNAGSTSVTPARQVRIKAEPEKNVEDATSADAGVAHSSPATILLQTQISRDVPSQRPTSSPARPSNTRKQNVPNLDRDGLQVESASNLEGPRTANYTRPSIKSGPDLLGLLNRGPQLVSKQRRPSVDHDQVSISEHPAETVVADIPQAERSQSERDLPDRTGTNHSVQQSPVRQHLVQDSQTRQKPITQTEPSIVLDKTLSDTPKAMQNIGPDERDIPQSVVRRETVLQDTGHHQPEQTDVWEQRQFGYQPTMHEIPDEQRDILQTRIASLAFHLHPSTLQDCVPSATLAMWKKPRTNKPKELLPNAAAPSFGQTSQRQYTQQASENLSGERTHARTANASNDVEMASDESMDTGSDEENDEDDDEEPIAGWQSTPAQSVPPSSGGIAASQSPNRANRRQNSHEELEMSVPQTMEQPSDYRLARRNHYQGEQRKEWLKRTYAAALAGESNDFSASEAAAAYRKRHPRDTVSAKTMSNLWTEMIESQQSSRSTKISATPVKSSTESKTTSDRSKEIVDSTERVPDSSEKPKASARHDSPSNDIGIAAAPSPIALQSQEAAIARPSDTLLDHIDQVGNDLAEHHEQDMTMSIIGGQAGHERVLPAVAELPSVNEETVDDGRAVDDMNVPAAQEQLNEAGMNIDEVQMPAGIQFKPRNEQEEQVLSRFETLTQEWLNVQPGGADFLSNFTGSNQRLPSRPRQNSKRYKADVLAWSIGSG